MAGGGRRWCEHDEAPRGFEQAAGNAYRALLWEERRQLFTQRTFLPPDPERLRKIDARLLAIGTVVADVLPDADMMTEVDLRFVD